MKPGPKPVPVEVRVWRRIVVGAPSECWPWTGTTNVGPKTRGGPYGAIGAGGKRGGQRYVHRVVYAAEIGPIPPGFHIDHLCKNTLCCNPAHLEAVPPRVNNARSNSPTSLNMRKTHCPRNHPYDERNTGYRHDGAWRYCRACAREDMAAKREAKRRAA